MVVVHSNQAALSAFLRRLSLRSELTSEERAAILALPGEIVEIPPRRDLVTPGKTIDFATLVVGGLVGRFDQMRDGGRQTVALYVAGDMCDLHSVPSPVAGWGISSLSVATVMKVPHTALRRLAADHPGIAMAFWRDTVADANILAKWVSTMGRSDALARVAHLLCEMGLRAEEADLGERTRYPLPATQEQIGDVTGLTSVHVNRTLRSLREVGAASFRVGVVEVLNPALLASVAGFDPDFLLLGRHGEEMTG